MKLPFAEQKASTDFMNEATRLMIRELDRRRSLYVATNNVQIFSHGRTWTFQQEGREGYSPQTGQMQLQQQKVTIDMDRLKSNDASVLPDFISGVAEQMEATLAAAIKWEFETIAAQSGNTVSVGRTGSMAGAYLEMLGKTSGSINAEGEFCPPRILFDSDAQTRLDRALAEESEEFRQQVVQAKQNLEIAAMRAEEERLKKFEMDE